MSLKLLQISTRAQIVGPAIAELTVLKAVGPDSGAPEVVAASAMLLSRVQSPLTDVQRTHPQVCL